MGATLAVGAAVMVVLIVLIRATAGGDYRVRIRDMPQERTGWFALDLRDVDVTPSKQDAIANLVWVKRFAHAWSPDAVLTWLETTVRADGFALDAPLITYKFISPARARARKELGGMGGAPPSGLTIKVVGDTARAFIMPDGQGTADTPEVALTCSFEDLMAAAVVAGGPRIAARPVHKLLLRHELRGQWAWQVGFLQVWLDPATCASIDAPAP